MASLPKTQLCDRPAAILLGTACLLFYVWVILLPLVGRSGAATPQASLNFRASLVVLLFSLTCSGIAVFRLRTNQIRIHLFLRILCAVQGLAVVSLVAGLLKV